jgi:hypothetical protein
MARIRERDGDGDLLALVKRIASAHDVTLDEMLGTSHVAGHVHARHALWAALYARGHWSYPRLGKLFGRDHSTVLAGVVAHCERQGIQPPRAKKGCDFIVPGEADIPQGAI